jgi:hypothetical protein
MWEEGREGTWLASELAEEFVLVHAVFEGFTPVDKNHGNFVGELATELIVRVHVNFLPGKTTTAMKLLDDLAQVAAFAAVHDDFAGHGHGRSVTDIN